MFLHSITGIGTFFPVMQHQCEYHQQHFCPFRLSKLGIDPVLATPFGRKGPRGEVWGIEISTRDRRRTLISIPPWFEPFFLGGQKTSKCEHSKNHLDHAVDRPKMHVVYTSGFKNPLLIKGKVHIATMHFFRNFGLLHFCTVFSTICGTVVEENEKYRRIEIRFSGPPWPILRLRKVEISVRDMCHKTSGFTAFCLSLWCRRCLWRVSSSLSFCDFFTIECIFDQKGLESSCFSP